MSDDDEKTQIIQRHPGGDPDKAGAIRQGGFASPPGSPRGHVIGSDLRSQPPVTPAQAPENSVPQPPRPDETLFFVSKPDAPEKAPTFDPVVGWLTVINGPGKGRFRPIFYGQNSVGRDPKQRIPLDFDDQRISRETHAFIVYDDVQRRFFIRDNGKSNLVRHNGNVVLMPTEISDRDQITIGDTTLVFVALCNSSFDWLAADERAKS
jgi:hypothetical protein